MKIDFSTPITSYELLAITLSILALLVPIIKAVWKKFFVSTVLSFLPTGRAILFFNQSGSYIRVDGVLEADNKPASIKKITIEVIRKKDDNKLKLSWSSFISPVNQNVVGNYLQTTESAHPLRIEANSIICAFTEFGDAFDSFGKKFRANTEVLFQKIDQLRKIYSNYSASVEAYKKLPEYNIAKEVLNKEFFWEIGKYDVIITVNYNQKSKQFKYELSVGEQENKLLLNNIEEALVTPLKTSYGVRWEYQTAFVELVEK